METQIHQFRGDTYKVAREERQRYEDNCRQMGTTPCRATPASWQRVNDRLVTITIEYVFTNLDRVWTEEAEANGILAYWWL